MSKVECPYCGSIQVKAMANQPKKYPRPTDPTALENWQKGYDCKKCGNDFIVAPPKPTSFLSKIMRIIFWLIVITCVVAFFIRSDEPGTVTNEPDAIEQVINEIESKDSDLKYNDGDPTPIAIEEPINQDFSKQAEKAAHSYIPQSEETEQKSIEHSLDLNDTLNFKTPTQETE